MRRVLAACTASVVMAACGGSSGDKTTPAQCPAPVAPSGTLTGAGGSLGAFTPAEMDALVAGPTSCTVLGNTVNVAGIFLGFTSFQGICTLLQAHGICFDKASATIVGVQIANVGLVQQPVPGPGTYTVGTVGTTVTSASYSRSGASCSSLGSSDATSGTITIDTVTATQVTGSMSLTFADNSTMAGTFTAAAASGIVNVCQLANQIAVGCGSTPPCVPWGAPPRRGRRPARAGRGRWPGFEGRRPAVEVPSRRGGRRLAARRAGCVGPERVLWGRRWTPRCARRSTGSPPSPAATS